MAFDLSELMKDVSRPDTGREQISYLPYASLIPDPNNGYSMNGLEELARSIEVVGLQQPLRVKALSVTAASGGDSSPIGGAKGAERYGIISGHRRHAAIGLILQNDPAAFPEGVPCIVDRAGGSVAMRELQLLLANADNRKLTSADEAQQAERISDCLRKLEDEGYVFPGRHRDWVSKLSGLSRTKLARLKVIKDRLVPELMAEFDRGRLGESVAYRLSQEPEAVQRELERKLGRVLYEIAAETLETCITQEQRGFSCHSERSEESEKRSFADAQDDKQCGGPDGGPPRASAPTEKTEPSAVDGLKRYLDAREKEDRQFWKLMQEAADNLIEHSFAAGAVMNRKENIDMLRLDCRNRGVGGFAADWEGKNDGLTLNHLGRHPIKRNWAEVYDALAAIAITRWRAAMSKIEKLEHDNNRLRKRLEVNVRETDGDARATARVAPTGEAVPQWQTGDPPRSGRYLCLVGGGKMGLMEHKMDFMADAPDYLQWKLFDAPLPRYLKIEGWWPVPEKGEETGGDKS